MIEEKTIIAQMLESTDRNRKTRERKFNYRQFVRSITSKPRRKGGK
jgi:hypothetical protein